MVCDKLYPALFSFCKTLEVKQDKSPPTKFLSSRLGMLPQVPICDYCDGGILRYRLMLWELYKDQTIHFSLGSKLTLDDDNFQLLPICSKLHHRKGYKIHQFIYSCLKFYFDSNSGDRMGQIINF